MFFFLTCQWTVVAEQLFSVAWRLYMEILTQGGCSSNCGKVWRICLGGENGLGTAPGE